MVANKGEQDGTCCHTHGEKHKKREKGRGGGRDRERERNPRKRVKWSQVMSHNKSILIMSFFISTPLYLLHSSVSSNRLKQSKKRCTHTFPNTSVSSKTFLSDKTNHRVVFRVRFLFWSTDTRTAQQSLVFFFLRKERDIRLS